MTDSLRDSRQKQLSAVAYCDDRPHFELAAEELVYPLLTRDERFKVYFHVRPYQPYAVKKFYDQVIPKRRRRTQNENTVESPNYGEAKDMVMAHLIRMSGVTLEDGSEPTIEQQKTWLDENPDFKERIFREGYDAVRPRRPETDGDRPKAAVLMFGRKELEIQVELRLYSSERNLDETLMLAHSISRLTESDRHQYDRAIQIIENSRRGEVYTEANWDVIEQLYNQRIRSIAGAVINGAVCGEGNKETWMPKVPVIQKFYVMAQAVGEVELKNA